MTRARIKIGDVFTVPVDSERVGVGQVVATYKKDGYFFAIFDRAYSRASMPVLGEAIRGRLLFLALSLDAKIAAGHRQIIGNGPVASDLPLPAFKEVVGTPDQVDAVDCSGERRRRATDDAAALLPDRTVLSPARWRKRFAPSTVSSRGTTCSRGWSPSKRRCPPGCSDSLQVEGPSRMADPPSRVPDRLWKSRARHTRGYRPDRYAAPNSNPSCGATGGSRRTRDGQPAVPAMARRLALVVTESPRTRRVRCRRG